MKNLNRTLVHSAELAKMLVHALEINTPDSAEKVRINRQIDSMHNHASQIEEGLQRLYKEYAVETNTAKMRLWERKLLDLSLRNNLLNMRMGKNCLPYNHPDIAQLEDEMADGRELLIEKKELKGLYRAVRINMEETGANTLFLTLGTLKWQEREGARQYMAPILLMPIEMVHVKKDCYAIRRRDEETIVNITLLEFLQQQYDIKLNGLHPLPQDSQGIDVSLVMHTIREAVKEHLTWEVMEESVIGIFSFTKFVLWNDIHNHPVEVMSSDVVRSLVEGRLLMDTSAEQTDARKMDREVLPEDLAIPVDADSSQLEAIADSLAGQSFLLYGPPGTGKSQTITNLIANAMYHGKRVLFVAQKKAALDVVHSRLQKIGLDAYCVELHSNKMEKHHFLQQLQQTIDAAEAEPVEDYTRIAKQLYAQRMQLLNYIDAMHAKDSDGNSAYECIEKYFEENIEPLKLPKDFINDKSKTELDALADKIAKLASVEQLLGMAPSQYPLYGFLPKYTPEAKPLGYAARFSMGDSLEKLLADLPQTVDNIKNQIERGKSMPYMCKTTRQYVEADYKWKKFAMQVCVEDSLLDDIDSLSAAVKRWSENIDKLPAWKQYADMLGQLGECGLQGAVDQYKANIPVVDIQRALKAAIYQQMAHSLILQNPLLNEFDTLIFEQMIGKYQALKREFQNLTRQELLVRLYVRVSSRIREQELSAQLTLLRKRIGNKGRGTSIRNIIAQMPDLLQVLCPVMLMIPLSVAQYLEMGGEKFDLVIFDEASQMPTSEAIGAIARAKACVVVGDPQQMPPTSFFSTNVTDDDEADIDDQESILDDCISLSMPARYLGWHYRSKHESLITFSNHNYYDSRLLTFPSVDDQERHVTWQHVDGFYDYGKSRTNQAEAEAIVAEVLKRLQHNPERSIGVVAFSRQQSELIEDLLNAALAKDSAAELRNRESEEPLFVKNLENVQGDERDVILFSVGYGPDKEGRVSMNFGPLNKTGGERRLNVAISRARYEMKIFSTLQPEQIDERRTHARGVLDLQEFLKFAQHGLIAAPSDAYNAQASHMVDAIADSIRQHGYEVRTSIGSSAFRVDIGIVDPANPHTYKLGIICDGMGYRKLKTVRDREVVQPAVLNMLGWRLMRVWAIDWFRHPEVVIKNILRNL